MSRGGDISRPKTSPAAPKPCWAPAGGSGNASRSTQSSPPPARRHRLREAAGPPPARGAALHRDPPVPVQWLPPGTGLIVEQEVAELRYEDGLYRCRVRRNLYNAGAEPVTRYLVKIAVDRYPHDPAGSNRHHREHPLTFDEMALEALAGEGAATERMHWRVKLDRDAAKEVWLLFANDR